MRSKRTGVRFSASPLGFSEIGYLQLPIRDMAEIPLKRRKSSIQQTNNQPKSFSITCYTSENVESDRLHLFPSHVVYIYFFESRIQISKQRWQICREGKFYGLFNMLLYYNIIKRCVHFFFFRYLQLNCRYLSVMIKGIYHDKIHE